MTGGARLGWQRLGDILCAASGGWRLSVWPTPRDDQPWGWCASGPSIVVCGRRPSTEDAVEAAEAVMARYALLLAAP